MANNLYIDLYICTVGEKKETFQKPGTNNNKKYNSKYLTTNHDTIVIVFVCVLDE